MSLVGTWRETHQVHINTNNYKYRVKLKRIFGADTIWIALSHATDWVQSSPIPCGEDYLEVSKVVAGVAMTS